MKPTQTNKQWLLPLIILCSLAGCKKDTREIHPPEATMNATDSRNSKFNCNNWIINTIAGNDLFGYSGDGGPVKDALLNLPENVYVDKRGNIFIADLGNQVFREIDAHTGIIHTV